MTPRRAVVALLLALLLFGVVAQLVHGPTAASSTPQATPDPAPTPPAQHTAGVDAALSAVQQAFNQGDVRALCHPGALVDPAVIHQQNTLPGGCESELEGLVANSRPMRLTVRHVVLRQDLAIATVTTAGGGSDSVDLVRGPRSWLLSFSGAGDPMPALAR
jgi:hypothetical protein